jgi:hypothetical protein
VTLHEGTGFIALRQIEAAREIADTLSRSRNITYIPQNSGSYLFQIPGITPESIYIES